MTYTYFLIHVFTLAGPFSFSFEKRIAFYKQWKYILPAIVLPAILFIIWDAVFTSLGVWSFNDQYIIGSYLWGLPVEEILFFFTIPYACLFIYAALNFYIKKEYLYTYRKWIGWALFITCLAIAAGNQEKLYTAFTCIFLAFVLLQILVLSKASFLGRFFLSYAVSFIPFLLVNGVLTALPVVRYTPSENLGIRIGTIPVEDAFYGLLLLLLNTLVYERAKKGWRRKEVDLPLSA